MLGITTVIRINISESISNAIRTIAKSVYAVFERGVHGSDFQSGWCHAPCILLFHRRRVHRIAYVQWHELFGTQLIAYCQIGLKCNLSLWILLFLICVTFLVKQISLMVMRAVHMRTWIDVNSKGSLVFFSSGAAVCRFHWPDLLAVIHFVGNAFGPVRYRTVKVMGNNLFATVKIREKKRTWIRFCRDFKVFFVHETKIHWYGDAMCWQKP